MAIRAEDNEHLLRVLHAIRSAGERREAPSWETLQKHRHETLDMLLHRERGTALSDSECGRLMGVLVALSDEVDRVRGVSLRQEQALSTAIDRATRRRSCVRSGV